MGRVPEETGALRRVLVFIRTVFGRPAFFPETPFFGHGAPLGVAQRVAWVAVAITAGICEEFAYRGMVLSSLLGRRYRVALDLSIVLVA